MHCSEHLSVFIKHALKTYNLLDPNLIGVSNHLDSHALLLGDDMLSKSHSRSLIMVVGETSKSSTEI